MSDKIIELFKVLIKCIPYLFVWYILFLMFSAAKSEGLLSGFSYIFGENLYIFICVIGILIFLSIFYLRFFLKKELIIQIISFGMTSLLIYVTLVLTNYIRQIRKPEAAVLRYREPVLQEQYMKFWRKRI